MLELTSTTQRAVTEGLLMGRSRLRYVSEANGSEGRRGLQHGALKDCEF